jgi:RNA polymerase sigma factor (sigma-70 family)
MSNDAELLRRYAEEGAEEAFTELVRQHVDFVYAAALRQTRNPHRAEDVTQVVFTDLARKAARLARRDELVGWLHTSTRYAAIKVVRAEARRERWEREAQMSEALLRDAEPSVDWGKLRPVLDEALGELNERDRTVILLHFFKGCTFAEVGTAARLTEEAARKRVERALEKLHGLLSRRGVTSTTAALAVALASQATAAAPIGLAASVAGTALAGAAIASGTTATLIGLSEFMATSKTVVSIAAIVGVLSIGTVVHEIQQAQSAESAAGAVQQENKALTTQLPELRRAAQAAEQARADLQRSVAEARSSAAKPKSPEDDKTAALRAEAQAGEARGREFLAAHPEFRPLLIAFQKLGFLDTNVALYRKLGLTPDQIDCFEAVLQERSSFSFSASSGESVGFNFATNRNSFTEQETQLRDILGEDNYAQYTEYSRTGGARQYTTELAAALYYTDSALTAEQTKQVELILAQNDATYRADKVAGYNLIDWDQVMAQAPGVLSARQLEAMNGIRAGAQYIQALVDAKTASIVAARKRAASAN